MYSFYSHGKLLISAEYVVLDGAKALALPTKFGQTLEIHSNKDQELIWESYNEQMDCWLHIAFELPSLRVLRATYNSSNDEAKDTLVEKLQQILLAAKQLNPSFLNNKKGLYAKSILSFNRQWGLGSSSTLINNVAKWAKIDAFSLQIKTFGGSGYDIACAQSSGPISYQITSEKPLIKLAPFNPNFKDQLFFIHLNKKQDTRQGIFQYKNNKTDLKNEIQQLTDITESMINCAELKSFEYLIFQHEKLISSIIKESPIQESLFKDYFGQTKSLGAWGGDFILATGNQDSPKYFKNKGFQTVLNYREMIL